MKNNKGYTLVELLIAMAIFAVVMAEVCNMMQQSSKLYLNGTYEIDLQTEAQQIVQQMEELLIDANVSVNVLPSSVGLSVNDVEIVNHDVTYLIRYTQPNPSVSYGNIYLTVSGASAASNALMGEYVESLSLNMAEYETASKITLEIALRNDKYTYTTSKDIYLRNDIGLGGGRRTPSPEGEFDEELDVLRFREYNLSSTYNNNYGGKAYTYRFRDGNDLNADYKITHSGTTYYLEAQTLLNNGHSRTAENMIDAIDPDTGAVAFTIKISTVEVKIGADGFGLFYEYVDISDKITSPVHVQGIYLGGATSIRWYLQAVENGTAQNLKEDSGSTYSGGSNYRFPGDLYVQVDNLDAEIRCDGNWNSILFVGRRVMNHENYYQAIRNGCVLKMVTVFEFPTGPDLTVNSYMYPSSANASDAMPEDVANIFWSNCR